MGYRFGPTRTLSAKAIDSVTMEGKVAEDQAAARVIEGNQARIRGDQPPFPGSRHSPGCRLHDLGWGPWEPPSRPWHSIAEEEDRDLVGVSLTKDEAQIRVSCSSLHGRRMNIDLLIEDRALGSDRLKFEEKRLQLRWGRLPAQVADRVQEARPALVVRSEGTEIAPNPTAQVPGLAHVEQAVRIPVEAIEPWTRWDPG